MASTDLIPWWKNLGPQESRFYVLSGCDAGDLLHRPRTWLEKRTTIDPATPLARQPGALTLAVSYLTHANGLAVLAHNLTTPVANLGPFYRNWALGVCLGDAYLNLVRFENENRLPHYRNILFGDATLKLRYYP